METLDYEGLFALLPDPMMVLCADEPAFTLVAENEAHARLINPKKLIYSIGKGLLEAYPDTSDEYKKTGRSALVESVREAVRTGEPAPLPDIRYDLADASGVFRERWWRATHYPLKEAGKVTRVLQITQDITDEIEARRTRDQAQAQLDHALAVGLVSSFNWNIQTDVLTGDRNLAKTFGVSAEDAAKGLPLENFTKSVHQDDLDRVLMAIQKTVDEGGTYEIEYRTVHADGNTGWVIARGAVQYDVDGKPHYFTGILIDITARKQAEAELENTKRMFDALFNSTILSVALADTNGNVIQANKTFLKSFGYSDEELAAGLNTNLLTAPGSREVTAEIYGAIKDDGESSPTEKQYVRKDGSVFIGLVGAAKVPGSDDHFMAFILDVTENRRLKQLNTAKDEFIALASHQLRTPATAVKQYLGIILEGYAGEVDPAQREYIQTASDSNDRELRLINDLLKTAKLDTKDYALNVASADLVKLMDDVVTASQPALTMKGQTVEFTHDDGVSARVDPEEMTVVFSNLVENAHKYSHDGSKIDVSVRRKGERAVITVRDRGVGISAKDQGSIFEKFTRVDNPLSDASNGTGLGLYWVKRIITLHGGVLSVESEVGKGTVFMVSLPL